MRTQFKSNLPNAQHEVCVEPSNFQDGQVPQTITVIYQNRVPYNYQFIRVDENGNYCYRLTATRVFGRKKKKSTPPPCACAATLIAEPTLFPDGTPLTLTYTTSPCADSASISRTPEGGIINAPPPGGVIVLNPGDPGYPVTGGNTYTLTVVTNTGECTATADIFVII